MAMTGTVRIMPAEEIAARAGGSTPFLRYPDAATVFADRAMRLRQLAAGHPMADYLRFVAAIAMAQQHRFDRFTDPPLPDASVLDASALAGQPPLPAADWPRPDAWRPMARQMAADVAREYSQLAAQTGGTDLGTPVRDTLERVATASDDWLEKQADALLTGVMLGVDVAAAPLVGAALQVLWTRLLLATRAARSGRDEAFGRIGDRTVCPCCGSRPTASVTRSEGESLGQRYLHCSLCNLEWHLVRICCVHCEKTEHVSYLALDRSDGAEGDGDSLARAGDGDDEHDGDGAARAGGGAAVLQPASSRAAKAAIQVESCDDCGHYLKIVHTDRDPFVEPVADDLASVPLDLLVSEAGKRRHGVNLMLLFGDPGPEPRPPDDRSG